MGLRTQAPSIIIALAAALFTLAACTHGLSFAADRQIRERIGHIRTATLAERAEGLVQYATPDCVFRLEDGRQCSRSDFVERARRKFQESDIDDVLTRIDLIDIRGERAEVQLHRTIVRSEGAPESAKRWKVVERESQDWVKTSRGWLLARVQGEPAGRELLAMR